MEFTKNNRIKYFKMKANMKSIFSFTFLGLFLIGCTNNNTNLAYYKKYNIQEFDSIKIDNWCSDCRCKKVIKKDIEFYFECDKEIPQAELLKIIIIRKGIIYKNNFSKHIKIPNLCFCIDNFLTKTSSISFVILDQNEGKVFFWSKEESYNLTNIKKVYVKLGVTDEYKIKFDNDWFYK